MAKRVVLIVDDEPLIVRLIQVNLERAGYGVQMASNGMEAMQLLHTADMLPSLILLDGIMPYMDGFEALSQMKADPRLQAIPVVMTSARSRDADLLEGEKRGASRPNKGRVTYTLKESGQTAVAQKITLNVKQ